MARLITRKEAAELLDCEPQTITNWVEKGAINGHKVGNVLMVDRESIEQYFDDFKVLADMATKIADLKTEYKNIIKDQEALLDEARGNSLTSQRAKEVFRMNQLTLISLSEGYLKDRESGILTEIIKGVKLEDIGNAFGLTRERVMQIATKAANKLASIEDLKQIRDENKTLKEENNRLSKENNLLKKYITDQRITIDAYENSDKLHSTIFEKRLIDLNLTVRTQNGLKSLNCDTLGDVVKLDMSMLLKARNFGKKSLTEIDEFIKRLGLHWGMNPEKMSVEELEAWRV
jgi:excisionase family DNA binding protein